jgi:hypothetical protein
MQRSDAEIGQKGTFFKALVLDIFTNQAILEKNYEEYLKEGLSMHEDCQ